jgi:hypothetical protein
MAKLVVEGRVLVVPHLDHAVVDPESVAEVLTDLMTADLDDPVVQILAVKKGNPLSRSALLWATVGEDQRHRNTTPASKRVTRRIPGFVVMWRMLSGEASSRKKPKTKPHVFKNFPSLGGISSRCVERVICVSCPLKYRTISMQTN